MAGFVKPSFHPLAGTRFGPPAAPRAARVPAAKPRIKLKPEPAAPAVRVEIEPQTAPARRRKRRRA